MVSTSEATLAWNRSRVDRSMQYLYEGGNRLSVWLVVGNAGALALVAQQLFSHPEWSSTLRPAMTWFFAGLVLAFLGLSTGYFASLRAVLLTEQAVGHLALIVQNEAYIDAIDREDPDHPVPDDAELYVKMKEAATAAEALRSPLAQLWWFAAVAMIFLGLSALSFGLGATVPLRGDPIAQATITATSTN